MADEASAVEKTATLLVPNRARAKLLVVIEPWANEYVLGPLLLLRIEVAGPTPPLLEVEYTEGTVIVSVMSEAWYEAFVERDWRPTESDPRK